MKTEQRVGGCSAQTRAASGTDLGIERILIERVHKAEMQGESAVRELLLPDSLYKEMNALDILQALLHLGCVARDRGGQYNGMELRAFHTGRLKQPPVWFAEALDLALNHAANGRRHIAANRLDGLRQDPTALVLNNDLPVPQVAHQVRHEQG